MGFRFCLQDMELNKGGLALMGGLKPMVGTMQSPLQVIGRLVHRNKTVGYRLSTGDVLPVSEIVMLMRSGIQVDGVHIVNGKKGAWLRSNPDEVEANNLVEMPPV